MQEQPAMSERQIGVITHYWGHLGVAGVHLIDSIDMGDHIHVLGHTTDLEQDVGSMQIEHHGVHHANPGEDVGIRVNQHVREHDGVFRFEREDVGADEGDL